MVDQPQCTPLITVAGGDARGACQELHLVYRRLLTMALEELRRPNTSPRRRCLGFAYWRSRASRKSGKSAPIKT
jgi:hypothetical protein